MKKEKIVRTKNKVLGGITPEEKIKLDAHAAKWIANAMSTEPVNHDRLTAAIKSLYATANMKEPRIVIVPSPIVMAFAGGFSAAIWWARKNSARAIKDNPDSATDSATANATANATDSATRSVTHENQFVSLALQLGEEFGVDSTFMLRCAQNWYSMHQGGNMWSAYDCYLTAYRDVLGLVLPEHEKYKAWEACALEGGFRIVHEEFCIASDRPEILKVDNENRPHCENGPSHRWRDGWSLYHWHGVVIPGEWVSGKPPTAKEALTWQNIEQRRAACEIVGWAKILQELNATVIDEDDEEIGTLLEVDLPESGKERFLKVRCGTGREFALPVPREMKTAIQANSWTYSLNPEDFSPEVRT